MGLREGNATEEMKSRLKEKGKEEGKVRRKRMGQKSKYVKEKRWWNNDKKEEGSEAGKVNKGGMKGL